MKTDRLYQLTSHLLMAACVIFFAGFLSSCYDETPTDEVPVSGKWQISIPATIDMNADTRSLEYKDGRLTAKFSIKDNIYVIKNGTVDSQPLHPDQDGATANLEGYLAGRYTAGDELTLVYNTNNDGTFSFKEQTGGKVENEDLDAFDYAMAKVKVKSVNGEKISTTPAKFESLQSMYKFTFVDEKGDPVNVTKLLVSTKLNDLMTAGSVSNPTEITKGSVSTDIAYSVDGIDDGVVWVALRKCSNDADTFIFDALDNDNNVYMGTLDVKKDVIQNGKFYTATITLIPQNPLTLEATETGTITISNPNGLVMQYRIIGSSFGSILEQSSTTITIDVKKGERLQLFGDNETYCVIDSDIKNTNIQCSSDCYIYGNIMSLIDSDGYDTATTLTGEFTFMKLFEGNKHIKNHTDKALILPATTLTEICYAQMFEGCSSLTTAPELPAEIMTNGCYELMFSGCTGLTTAPELPAETLAKSCYNSMFQDCSDLTTAPEKLPATTLAESCYYQMFSGCGSLETAPELPATTLTNNCYAKMFYDCSSLTSAPDLPATTLAESCYSQMFESSSLTTVPELPATTLAKKCYECMFAYCGSLETAPELPAKTLVESCYSQMFVYCGSLKSVTCLATDISANICTLGWLDCVAGEGTFTKAATMEEGQSWSEGVSGIPSGWRIKNYGDPEEDW